MQKLLPVYCYSWKSRHKPNLESTSKYGFFPRFERKMAAFWACACKLSWIFFSPARVQPLYGAGRKESSRTGLRDGRKYSWPSYRQFSVVFCLYCVEVLSVFVLVHDHLNEQNAGANIQLAKEIKENGKLPRQQRTATNSVQKRRITWRIILQPDFTQSHDYKGFHESSATGQLTRRKQIPWTCFYQEQLQRWLY